MQDRPPCTSGITGPLEDEAAHPPALWIERIFSDGAGSTATGFGQLQELEARQCQGGPGRGVIGAPECGRAVGIGRVFEASEDPERVSADEVGAGVSGGDLQRLYTEL